MEINNHTDHHTKIWHLNVNWDKSNFHMIRSLRFCHLLAKWKRKKVQTDTPGKFITHYLFECYDITPVPSSEVTNDMLVIWECGRRDERTVLNLLSRNITELDIVCDVQPNSKTTTYQIYAREWISKPTIQKELSVIFTIILRSIPTISLLPKK
jgi:hypothetical protein